MRYRNRKVDPVNCAIEDAGDLFVIALDKTKPVRTTAGGNTLHASSSGWYQLGDGWVLNVTLIRDKDHKPGGAS